MHGIVVSPCPCSESYQLTLMKASLSGGQGQGTCAILPLRFGPSQSPNSAETWFRNGTSGNGTGRTVWIIVWLRPELGGKLSHDFAGNAIDSSVPAIVHRWSR